MKKESITTLLLCMALGSGTFLLGYASASLDIPTPSVFADVVSQEVVDEINQRNQSEENKETQDMQTSSGEEEEQVSYEELIQQDISRNGDGGRIYIPDHDISVALFKTTSKNIDQSQKFVDDKDSAAIFELGCETCVADHRYQEFLHLKNVQPGTHAYIRTEESIEDYICIDNAWGTNDGHQIITDDGRDVEFVNDGGLCLYTCDFWKDRVIITFWRNADEVPLIDPHSDEA